MNDNHREPGARKPVQDHRPSETDQDAGMPKKPKPYGLTEPVDDVDAKVRPSDGQQSSRKSRGPAVEQATGAGPALAEHSKDAKAGKPARQPGAHSKK